MLMTNSPEEASGFRKPRRQISQTTHVQVCRRTCGGPPLGIFPRERVKWYFTAASRDLERSRSGSWEEEAEGRAEEGVVKRGRVRRRETSHRSVYHEMKLVSLRRRACGLR